MWNVLADWLKQPFREDQDAYHWFAFIGLLIVSLYIWHAIARDWRQLDLD